jgi:ATP-dependent protease Clp ATPase subunit
MLGEQSEILRCSFCGKTDDEVETLIANPADRQVCICDECVAVCNWVLQEHRAAKGTTLEDRLKASVLLSCDPPKPDTLIDRLKALKAFAGRR